MGIFGFDDLGQKGPILSEEKEKSCCGNGDGDGGFFGSGFDDEILDLFVWETPAIASLDDLIVANDTNHGFTASDVPSVPKNRNATCGQHMEETLRQLRELAKSDPTFSHGNQGSEALKESHTPLSDLNSPQGNFEGNLFPSYKSSDVIKWYGDPPEVTNHVFVPSILQSNEENARVPDNVLKNACSSVSQGHESQDEKSQNPVSTENMLVFGKTHEINSQERDSALSRYKEKKKTRRYEKHIRYESRKIRAEGRTRVRGRFAKIEQ